MIRRLPRQLDFTDNTIIVCFSMAREKNDGKGRMGGRQKGTPNKTTAKVKNWLARMIEKNRKQMEEDLQELDPKERLQILEKFMAYVVPKQQAVSATIDYNKLTDEQLDIVIAELTKDIPEDEKGGEA